MRHSDCWLRGKLGGCHLLMLLLKVVFSPTRLCKAPPSIQPWGRRSRGCSSVPGGWGQRRCPFGRAGSGCAGGGRGDSGAPRGSWQRWGCKRPVAFTCGPSDGAGWGCSEVSASHWDARAVPAPLRALLARGQWQVLSWVPREPREGIWIRRRPREEKCSTGLCPQHRSPLSQLSLHHQTLLLPLHPPGEILAGFVPIPTLQETPGSP